jgi:hypothetical protein
MKESHMMTDLDLTGGWELPRRPAVPDDLPAHPDPLAINGVWSVPMLDVFRVWKPHAIYVCGFAAPIRADLALEGRDTVGRYGQGNMAAVPVYVGTTKARTTLAADRLDTMPWPELEVHILARLWFETQAHADQALAETSKRLVKHVETCEEPAYRGQWHEVRRIGVAGVVEMVEAVAAEKRFQCWDEAALAVFCDDVARAARGHGVQLGSTLDLALGRIVGRA